MRDRQSIISSYNAGKAIGKAVSQEPLTSRSTVPQDIASWVLWLGYTSG